MDPITQGQPASDDYFDINKFEQLLARLETSKQRQQGANVEDVYVPNM